MTRIPRIRNREDAPEGGQVAYDEIRGSRGEVSGPFSVLLNSPEMSRQRRTWGLTSGSSPVSRRMSRN